MTKQILRDCIIEMLDEKPLSAISVRELCNYADINRSTFYAHYKDIYDLFDSLVQETIDHLTDYMEMRVRRDNQEEALTDLLIYFKNNKKLFLILIRRSETYVERLHETIYHVYQQYYQTMNKDFSKNDEYIIEFNTAGMLRLTQKWLMEGAKQSPREMSRAVFSIAKDNCFPDSEP